VGLQVAAVNKMIGSGKIGDRAPVDRRRTLLLLGVLLVLLPISSQIALGQESNRAALVVRFGDDRTESVCVSFPEETITGYDLLQRSGLEVATDNSGAGVKVCRLDDTGCAPGNCFCQCQGDPCIYWSYWQRPDGAWQYAIAGAAVNEVADGDVEGWSWGPGSVTEAIAPPDVSFEEVCAATAPASSPTKVAEVPPATSTENVAATPMTSTGLGHAADGDNAPSIVTYGTFIFLLLTLAAFFIWTRKRGNA
jgi:hypothetical protein